MSKTIIVYESKWGNTRLVAESIAEGMKEDSGTQAVLKEVDSVNLNEISDFDAVLVGSPNHIGRATASIRKFIDKLGKLSMEGKQAAVFDTYVGGDFEKAVRKMEKQIREKVPGLKVIAPGLSIEVKGMKGPIAEDELPKCREFGVRIAKGIAQPSPQ
jgi:flavorubredoxin